MRKKPSIRCSELDRILACPGSILLNRMVDPREGDEGTEGTYLHHLAHTRIKKELGAVGDLGPVPPAPESKNGLWIAQYYFREVKETIPENWSLECEASLEWEFDNFILTGHPDDIGMSTDCTEAIGLDLKCGYNPVDIAEENWQMCGYGVLLKMSYKELMKLRWKVVQPRNDEDDGIPRVSEFTLEPSENDPDPLARMVKILEDKINDAIQRGLELETGAKQCRWCSAKLQCPAKIKEREQMKHILTDDDIAMIERQPSDAILADWVISAKALKPAFEDAETLAKKRVQEQGSLSSTDGHVLTAKTSAGSYEVLDSDSFHAAFKNLLPDEESLIECFKPSMTKIKDRIAEKHSVPKSSKRDGTITSSTIFDGHLRPFVKQGERVSLVVT